MTSNGKRQEKRTRSTEDVFRYESEEEIQQWRRLFAHLIDVSLEIASLTGPVVGSSSPEGLMPMELTDGTCLLNLRRPLTVDFSL